MTGLFDDVVSTPPRNHAELLRVIRGVRRRWRLKVALRGAAIVLGFGLLAFGIAAFALDHFRYSPWAIATFRILAYATVIALVARYLAIPLLTRLGDERVALYVEEHDPNLQAALLSAVAWDPERVERERPDLSPALAGRLLEEVIDRCETIDYGRAVEGHSLQRFTGALAGVALAAMMAVLLSPAFVRQAAPFLLMPWGVGAGETPYQVAITPGDAQLARGSDQMVVAQLLGFDSEEVEISVRRGAQGVWVRAPMSLAADDAGYSHMLLDVDEASDYFVEASGVRSPVYRLDVVDVPYVDRIDLEFHFPAHTGLSSRTIEDGGDIAALAGTEVRLSVTPTVAVPAGRIKLEASEPSDLERHESGILVGTLTVAAEGFYRIELEMPDGTIQTASPDYRIEVLSDQPPAVRFLKPGRDARVSAIEEVFTEVQAEDDFGIASVDLVYSVNGGPDQELPLHSGPRARRSLSVGHTFFLEEEELEPGDFISYFARARDNGSPRARTTTTDILFMEIRPFGKIYRQAGQMGGGGGGGGDGSTLSHQQRQIVAATFRLVRDVSTLDAAERAQDVTTLALLQGRLRDQVSNLHGRILGRGILDAGEEFQGTGDSLESAIDEMTASEAKLLAGRPDEALGPEQRALKYLQRAEAAFREVQVAFGGGPGGGGGQMAAEDLADLFDLELDKLENQYETVRRRQQAQADEQVDEALQRLQELARRQQQENERQRQLRGRLPNQGGGGGGVRQRELAEQAEELGRQLERLARQQRSPTLSDTARRLRDASDAMRRSRTAQADDRLAEGIAALDRLRDARQALERGRSGRLERDLEDALGSMEGLQRAQARIAEEVRALGDEKGERLERLLERKDQLADGVEALEAQLDRMSREVRRSKQEASRRLQGASDTIRETKLKEKIRYSKGFVQARPGPDAELFEAEIRGDLDLVAERLGEVEAALGPSEGERATASLERTRDLVRRLESLTERLEERAQGGAEGAPGDQEDGAPQAGEDGQGGAGLAAGGGAGRLSAEGVRQIRSELRERRSDLRELERELERAGRAPGGLREIDDRLGGLDNLSAYKDPRGVADLVAAALEDLKLFEYALSRQIEGADPKQLRLSDTDELPPGWRQLVEEYYRSLAREP